MAKHKFPKVWTLVLIFSVLWFGKEMGWIGTGFDFPWLPAIIGVFAIGAIVNNYT